MPIQCGLTLEGDSVLFLRFHGWNMVCQDVTKIDVSRGEISIECEVEETNGWSLSINRVTGRFDITQNRLLIVDVASGTCRAIEKKF